jgi:hypothetical protein
MGRSKNERYGDQLTAKPVELGIEKIPHLRLRRAKQKLPPPPHKIGHRRDPVNRAKTAQPARKEPAALLGGFPLRFNRQ